MQRIQRYKESRVAYRIERYRGSSERIYYCIIVMMYILYIRTSLSLVCDYLEVS